jgi:hypothetical protein
MDSAHESGNLNYLSIYPMRSFPSSPLPKPGTRENPHEMALISEMNTDVKVI